MDLISIQILMCFKSSQGILSVAQLIALSHFVRLHGAAVKGWNVKQGQ